MKTQPIWQPLPKSMSKSILGHRQYDEFFGREELSGQKGFEGIEESTLVDTRIELGTKVCKLWS